MVSWFFGIWNEFFNRIKVYIYCGEVFKVIYRRLFKLWFIEMIYI